MKFAVLVLMLSLVVIIGGFTYFALSDVKIVQTTVSKEIPADHFLKTE